MIIYWILMDLIYFQNCKISSKISRIDYFLYPIDKAISTLQSRFEQFKMYEDILVFYLV